MDNTEKAFYKINLNKKKIEQEYDVDLKLFLDAISLGLSNHEISYLIGYDLNKVKSVRKALGNLGSEIGINYRKDMPPD